jgi:hypothetical protein
MIAAGVLLPVLLLATGFNMCYADTIAATDGIAGQVVHPAVHMSASGQGSHGGC